MDSPSSTSASASRSSTGKVPMYRGIRSRGGKWVSEIREPKKTTRIWLGTFLTPEMAAAAYDAAVLALKGSEAVLNFPEDASWYPVPLSTSPGDIQKAAATGAAMRQARDKDNQVADTTADNDGEHENEFVDMEAVFNMPNFLIDMAGAMMITLPRMSTAVDDYDDDYGGGSSLWSYD
ncbi:hypothetical protein vseg_006316 [Gypsophila vaccaria]